MQVRNRSNQVSGFIIDKTLPYFWSAVCFSAGGHFIASDLPSKVFKNVKNVKGGFGFAISPP